MDKNKGLVLCSLESTNTSEQVGACLSNVPVAVPRGVVLGHVWDGVAALHKWLKGARARG